LAATTLSTTCPFLIPASTELNAKLSLESDIEVVVLCVLLVLLCARADAIVDDDITI
jgi:hypothetical protein